MCFPLRCSRFSLVLAALAMATPALATNVPGDYATIQAALNAGATQIFVSEGTYHEVLSVTHDVELLPRSNGDMFAIHYGYPIVDGLSIVGSSGIRAYVRGFRFVQLVTANLSDAYGGELDFDACRFDAGLTVSNGFSGPSTAVNVRGCQVFGNLYVVAYYPDLTANTIVGGGITAHANGGGSVRDNVILGPATQAIVSTSGDAPTAISGNLIRGTQDGIVAVKGTVSGNIVEDCTGTAYQVPSSSFFGVDFINNIARRCGGYGVNVPAGVSGAGSIQGNAIDSVGLSGIHVGSSSIVGALAGNYVRHARNHGIFVEGYAIDLSANRVLFASNDGIRSTDVVRYNVVGRCGGRGILAPFAQHNTSYENAGAGYELTGAATDSIDHNIAFANVGPGLRWSGTGTPIRGCNDWFSNAGGATSGVAPGATDRAVDPKFCDYVHDVVTLASTSPLLNASGCGLIGALGRGCDSALVGVSQSPERATSGLSVRPLPARGAMSFSWAPGSGEVLLEVFDVSGAVRWSARPAPGTETLQWDGRDSRGVLLPAGAYFARKVIGGEQSGTRVVIVR